MGDVCRTCDLLQGSIGDTKQALGYKYIVKHRGLVSSLMWVVRVVGFGSRGIDGAEAELVDKILKFWCHWAKRGVEVTSDDEEVFSGVQLFDLCSNIMCASLVNDLLVSTRRAVYSESMKAHIVGHGQTNVHTVAREIFRDGKYFNGRVCSKVALDSEKDTPFCLMMWEVALQFLLWFLTVEVEGIVAHDLFDVMEVFLLRGENMGLWNEEDIWCLCSHQIM